MSESPILAPRIRWPNAPPAWTLERGAVLAGCADLDRWTREHPESREYLSPEELERARRFRFDEHRRRFIAARSILRCLLARCLGGGPRDVCFAVSASGKPGLPHDRGEPRVCFNASRSGGLGLFALTAIGELGVDIERIRALPDMEDVARAAFSAGERRAIEDLAAAEKERAFFAAWTRKEAYLKATGTGLSGSLEGDRIPPEPHAADLLTSIARDAPAGEGWCVLDLDPADGHAAALAIEAREFRLERWCWT